MKTLLYLTFVLMPIANGLFAQSSLLATPSSGDRIGIEVGTSQNHLLYNTSSIHLTFSKKNYQAFAGYVQTNQLAGMKGGQLGCRFFPYGTSRHFCFFFDYTFSYLQGKRTTKAASPLTNWSYQAYAVSVEDYRIIDNWLGFGFQYHPVTSFYIGVSAAASPSFGETETNYFYSNGNFTSRTSWSLFIYGGYKSIPVFPTRLKLSAGFTFGLKNKRTLPADQG